MPKTKKSDNSGGVSSKDCLRWTPEMDALLLDALLDKVHKGNRPDGTFTSMAYATVVTKLKQAIGPFFQKQHIKNRMKTLKDHFNECYDLFHKWSGIAWNPITRMFEAEQEVWNEICLEKPEAQKWKRTPIHNYDKLLELFGRDRATGAYVETHKDKACRWEKDGLDLNDSFDIMTDSDVQWGSEGPSFTRNVNIFGLEGVPSNNYDEHAPSSQSQGTSSSKGSKRKAHMVNVIENGCERLNIGINNLSNVMREVADKHIQIADRQAAIAEKGLSILQNSRPRHYSKADVW